MRVADCQSEPIILGFGIKEVRVSFKYEGDDRIYVVIGTRVERITLLLLIVLIGGCTPVPAPAPDEAPTLSPTTPLSATEGDSETITLALAGDVMLARLVNEAIRANGPLYPWGDVLPLVREADLSLVNLECVIAESGEPFEPARVFYFKADPHRRGKGHATDPGLSRQCAGPLSPNGEAGLLGSGFTTPISLNLRR
jgi:hypothetical protein